MISFLMGIIEEKNENSAIINVNGVGFNVIVSTNTLSIDFNYINNLCMNSKSSK